MKRIAIILAAMLAAFCFVSCNKEDAPAQTEKQKIQFDFTVGSLLPETKAAKTDWVDGDKINIWFEEFSETAPDLVITYDGSKWNAGELRDGCELTEGTGKNLVALYESQNDLSKYSLASALSPLRAEINYKVSSSVDNSTQVLSPASMMAACSATYSFSDRKLTSKLENWGFSENGSDSTNGVINGFQVTIEGIPDGEYAMHCVANSADNKNYLSTAYSVYVQNRRIKRSPDMYVSSQASDGTAVFYFSRSDQQPTEDITSIPTTFTLIPKTGDTYSSSDALAYTATIPTLKKLGSYQPVKIAYSKFKSLINGHEWVDMGTGVKWATMNVGANSPEESGYYYAWGEIESKEDYSETSYTYHDTPATLPASNDAATANWGGTWRMPTSEEWSNLAKTRESSDYAWTWCDGTNVKYNNSNVTGMKIEKKSTGATLFLPVAGYKTDDGLHVPQFGYYWSSSAHQPPSNRYAYSLDLRKTVSLNNQGIRYEGYLVRPVSE